MTEVAYLIHDNYFRPFKVVYDKKNVFIYKKKDKRDIGKKGMYNELITVYPKVIKFFRGRDESCKIDPHPKCKPHHGNSILVEISPQRYVYIGDTVCEFDAPEPIVAYFSNIGNNDVPYPVAVTENMLLFMLDRKYVARDKFPVKMPLSDAYSAYYGNAYTKDPLKKYAKPLKKIKILCERYWFGKFSK